MVCNRYCWYQYWRLVEYSDMSLLQVTIGFWRGEFVFAEGVMVSDRSNAVYLWRRFYGFFNVFWKLNYYDYFWRERFWLWNWDSLYQYLFDIVYSEMVYLIMIYYCILMRILFCQVGDNEILYIQTNGLGNNLWWVLHCILLLDLKSYDF